MCKVGLNTKSLKNHLFVVNLLLAEVSVPPVNHLDR